MLVDPDECAVDENIFKVGILAERLETRSQTPFCAQCQKQTICQTFLVDHALVSPFAQSKERLQ